MDLGTPRQRALTIGGILTGAALIAVGGHLSYVNVSPQQARIKARSDLLKAHLRKKYGYDK